MQFSEEKAIVRQIDGEFVLLETENTASCNNCSAKSGCGKVSSIFTFKPKNKIRVRNTLKLKKGDAVIVGMASEKLLKAAALMYLTPLVLLFLFAVLAQLFFGETTTIFAGLIGLFTGLFLVKQYTQKQIVADNFQPQLIQKIFKVNLV